MGTILDNLENTGLIKPPGYVIGSCQYLTIMGSESYGVSSNDSDIDLYGFCIPPKDVVFPNVIHGFDEINRFDQWQQHHILFNNKEYDIQIFNIIKFFRLCTDAVPNTLDSLYTPQRCILQASKIGDLVRTNRSVFLSKKIMFSMRGYSFSQLHKAKTKKPVGKRKESVERDGVDLKFLYHVVRLSDQAEQLLETGHMDIERSKEMMKAIRRGEWSLEDVEKWFYEKERHLEKLYHESNVIPNYPDREKIRNLLLKCLEEYYGSIDKLRLERTDADKMLSDIKQMIERAGY